MASKACTLALLAAFCACGRKAFEIPALSDEPLVEKARSREIRLSAPGYGLALSREGGIEFEVNIEADDASSVRLGDACEVRVPPAGQAIACRVSRVLRSASGETGGAIAWLSPRGRASVSGQEFVFATITTRVKRRALVVPSAAVLAKDGRCWVVRRKGEKFEPVEVSTGAASAGLTEILSGLSEGDEAVVQGGLGYLYSEFKAAAEE